MSNLQREAEKSVQAVQALHTHHSKMTWNAGTPGIDPWLRDTLVSLQGALNTIAATQVKIAAQVDRNSDVISEIANHLNQQRR